MLLSLELLSLSGFFFFKFFPPESVVAPGTWERADSQGESPELDAGLLLAKRLPLCKAGRMFPLILAIN